MFAEKSKTIKGDLQVELNSQKDFDIFLLQRKHIQCLKNPDGCEIYELVLLKDGVVYTPGPKSQ